MFADWGGWSDLKWFQATLSNLIIIILEVVWATKVNCLKCIKTDQIIFYEIFSIYKKLKLNIIRKTKKNFKKSLWEVSAMSEEKK